MYFSKRGHTVIAVDNYFRRNACAQINSDSLLPLPNLTERAEIWKDFSGKTISVHIGDVTDYKFFLNIFKKYKPETVIHYAEQPSAPYSMMGRDKAAFTVWNNLVGTLNIVYAIKESRLDCHIIKLGTMGEYGTPNIDIEEGWLDIKHKGRKDRFLFPRQASSLYHTTKIQDTDLLWFYVRTWGIRVTDLMQGPVYGIWTDEVENNERLLPNLSYDEVFGTVLNRFAVQVVAGYPLTVYGKGGQTRGYINLKDTLQCVYLSAMNPAQAGELRIFNQITETFSVNMLARKMCEAGKLMGYNVRIRHVKNPRKEKEKHYYNPCYRGLLKLGLKPHYVTSSVLKELIALVKRYSHRINKNVITMGIEWK